jgi:signal transduction histidine kinase
MTEAHYMASLIHNLALAAKLEAGAPEVVIASLDLNALIERVTLRHQPIARTRDIALAHATPERVLRAQGDVTFIEQAVGNIVGNAVHHAASGGHVAIILRPAGATGFAIEVVDDGDGMTDAELRRGNAARTRAPHGRGLGLDIVQRVVQLHAWQLSLASVAPRGLSVVIGGPLDDGDPP